MRSLDPLHAGNGDLIVNGNLGIGTSTTPSTVLDVRTGLGQCWTGAYNVDALIIGAIPETGETDPLGTITRLIIGSHVPNVSGLSPGEVFFTKNTSGSYMNYGAGIGGWSTSTTWRNLGLRLFTSVSTYTEPQTRMVITHDGKVGIGTTTPGSALEVNGTITGTLKNFDIKDPRSDDNRVRLIHSSLEGPEVGVYYRGEATLQNGRAVVSLPPYFEALAREENRTVLLTPKFESEEEPVCGVATSDVTNGEFTIRAFGVSNPSACGHKVFWEVKAERKDVEKLSAEQIREEIPQ